MKSFFLCLLACLTPYFTIAAQLPSDATTWTIPQVQQWIGTLDTASEAILQERVHKHKITGNILMLVEDSDLEQELGVTSGLERKRVLAARDALKDSDNERNAALGFWELRNLNRQMVDYTTPLLTTAPRWAITTFDDYPSYCQPLKGLGEGQHVVFAWVEWLLFPEWYIWSNRDSIMCGLPGFVPYVVWINLATSLTALMTTVCTGNKNIQTALLYFIKLKLQGELSVGVFNWCWSAFLWPFIPWFICDLVFTFCKLGVRWWL